jgi:hypothetical protein
VDGMSVGGYSYGSACRAQHPTFVGDAGLTEHLSDVV